MNRVNQNHGILFEDVVREKNGCLGIPRIDGPFDVPAVYNKEFGLDVSVKTVRASKTGLIAPIGLASAMRFAAINTGYQMVVGVHEPCESGKLITQVHTYVISKEFHKTLLGGLTAEEMLRFDTFLKAHRKNMSGDVMARDYAIKTREALMTKYNNNPLVELAYKVNSDNRRLQMTISIEHLFPALVRVDETNYRGTRLPLLFSGV